MAETNLPFYYALKSIPKVFLASYPLLSKYAFTAARFSGVALSYSFLTCPLAILGYSNAKSIFDFSLAVNSIVGLPEPAGVFELLLVVVSDATEFFFQPDLKLFLATLILDLPFFDSLHHFLHQLGYDMLPHLQAVLLHRYHYHQV